MSRDEAIVSQQAWRAGVLETRSCDRGSAEKGSHLAEREQRHGKRGEAIPGLKRERVGYD